MRRVPTVLVLLVGLGGCSHVFRVMTVDRVCLEGPIHTQSHVVTETPPVSNGGPVVAMPVDGGPGCVAGPRVAIVDVDGLLLNTDLTGLYSLGENPVSVFREKFDAIAADPSVCAVVLRINSPGGGVTASDMMWRDLRAFKQRTQRPVVACLLDVGAGGAYYLATAADLIVAHPTSITGGIGVILNSYNLRDAMQYFNVLGQAIKSGPQIDMGSTASALTPVAKKLLQDIADEMHERFRQVVVQARPAVPAGDPGVFDGRVFTARVALEKHLIDSIGYLDDAVAAAKSLAHVEQARVVLFHRPNDPAHSPYAVSPNVPLQSTLLPLSIPGLDRSRMPSFLYMWQPEATMEKLSGR